MDDTRRFNEPRRLLPAIIQRMVCTEVPPRVDCWLTELRQSLQPVQGALKTWSENPMPQASPPGTATSIAPT